MGYTPAVKRYLEGRADVRHNPGNGGDSANVLANVEAWLADARPDIVTLNCGLHDIHRDRATGQCQVPAEAYRDNLAAILGHLKDAGTSNVWLPTTPVIEARHQAVKPFDRYNRDVDSYNRIALELVSREGLPTVDLHAAARELGLEAGLLEDGVHFTDEAYEHLGRVVAAELEGML
jgi:lysophospholipase L1-like esterase